MLEHLKLLYLLCMYLCVEYYTGLVEHPHRSTSQACSSTHRIPHSGCVISSDYVMVLRILDCSSISRFRVYVVRSQFPAGYPPSLARG